jgi:hypothetical protein
MREDDGAVRMLGTDAFAEKTHQLHELRILVGDFPHDFIYAGHTPIGI